MKSEAIFQILHIRVIARANVDMIAGWQTEGFDTLVVRVSAAPEKGKANAAVIKVLAQSLQIPKSSIEITQGHSSRYKTITFLMSAEMFGAWRDGLPILTYSNS